MSPRLAFATLAMMVAVTGQAPARAAPLADTDTSCAAHAPEAAARSGLSAEITLRVMRAESGGYPRALSTKGAMGCMQIMPTTWAYLSSRYALGSDPFNPRMNMIGGAMYLAELAARYGFPGAFAAYNAGPGRYERYTAGRAVLPMETIAYTARIGAVSARAMPAGNSAARWQEAALFIARAKVDQAAIAAKTADTPSPVRRDALFPFAGPAGVQTASTAGP